MLIIAKSFKKQLAKNKIALNDIISAINRVFDKKLLRKGDSEISNSFIQLKNCKVYKIRVGEKQQARMLALYMIVDNIKLPFYIAKKSNKHFGENISLDNLKIEINRSIEKILAEFDKNEYDAR